MSNAKSFRNRANRDETTEDNGDDAANEALDVCPECGGEISTSGDTDHCRDCGLVTDEEADIDYGPEWRSFDSDGRQKKSRVGSPVTKMLHDKGLSTQIDWSNKDGRGNPLTAEKRRQIERLRTWDERARAKDSKERGLKQALGEIDRMSSALGLPDSVRETASAVYRRALNEDMLRGRSIEGMASAAVIAGCRQCDIPRTIRDVSDVSRVSHQRVSRAYRYISEELNLKLKTPTPLDHLPQLASKIDVRRKTVQKAENMIRQLQEEGLHSGRNQLGIAAAALYLTDYLTGKKDDLTQKHLSNVAQVSEVTIRNRKEEFRELIIDGTIETEFSRRMPVPQSNTVETPDSTDEFDEVITITMHGDGECGESQADTFARAIRVLIEDHGLLNEIDLPYLPNEKFLNAWLHSRPEQPFGESHGYWREVIEDEVYVQAKMNSEEKKDRIRHFAAIVGVGVTFDNW